MKVYAHSLRGFKDINCKNCRNYIQEIVGECWYNRHTGDFKEKGVYCCLKYEEIKENNG